jgi:hypothetical protein
MDNCRFKMKDGNYEFSAFGGPIDTPANSFKLSAMLSHPGRGWSTLSMRLHINKEAFAKEIYEPDHPRNFKKKADLLKEWFKGHPELQPVSDSVMAVLPKIKTTAQTRHLLAHGSIEEYDATSGTITFNSIRPHGNDEFTALTETLNIQGVLVVAELANAANRFLVAVAMDVFGSDAFERFQTP